MEKNYLELFKSLSIENKEKVNKFIDILAKKQKNEHEKQKAHARLFCACQR